MGLPGGAAPGRSGQAAVDALADAGLLAAAAGEAVKGAAAAAAALVFALLLLTALAEAFKPAEAP